MEEHWGAAVGQRGHVLSTAQFDRDSIEELFTLADELQQHRDQRLAGRIMAALFYEPSTRTRLSFESAMLRLGGSVISSEAAGVFSSAIKGETLEDTVQVVAGYADVIVLRHAESGAARRAAARSNVPIINAGDGDNDHPTQSLLDIYTISRELGKIDGLSLVICGDLRYGRTAHSMAQLLALYTPKQVTFVAPQQLQIDDAWIMGLENKGIVVNKTNQLMPAAIEADVVYNSRVRKEHIVDLNVKRLDIPRIDSNLLMNMKANSIVMDALPRIDAIAIEVDEDNRAAYFRQAHNGIAIRMALLSQLLSQ